MSSLPRKYPVTDKTRTLLGFCLGGVLMLAIVRIFNVNDHDFLIFQRGIRDLFSGVDPWTIHLEQANYYYPPHSVLFLWPVLYANPKIYLVLGGSLLFSIVFNRRAWVALAWFATNTALWLIAAGGIDMFVIGAGMLLLFLGDSRYEKRSGLFWRVMAYGMLMIKPQGAVYIVGLYILSRRDWKGLMTPLKKVVFKMPIPAFA